MSIPTRARGHQLRQGASRNQVSYNALVETLVAEILKNVRDTGDAPSATTA